MPHEVLLKHTLFDEFVKEPRIHYFCVPKLGSFLFIKHGYESCLSEEAFNTAIIDYLEVVMKRAEQKKERKLFKEELDAKYKACRKMKKKNKAELIAEYRKT